MAATVVLTLAALQLKCHVLAFPQSVLENWRQEALDFANPNYHLFLLLL